MATAIGRVLIRALTVFLAVLKPAEQMNAQMTTPPGVPRPRPEEYRPVNGPSASVIDCSPCGAV